MAAPVGGLTPKRTYGVSPAEAVVPAVAVVPVFGTRRVCVLTSWKSWAAPSQPTTRSLTQGKIKNLA